MSTRIRETDGDIVAATRAMYAAYCFPGSAKA